MRCFMHPQVEATSVCKKCGKAMCIDCSSYTEHSGICPACKKEEYEAELNNLNYQLSKNLKAIIFNAVFAIVLTIISIFFAIKISPSWAIFCVVDIVCGIIILIKTLARKPIKQRIEYLICEIAKINLALNQGTKLI